MSALQHRFGPYGGQYVPETLLAALRELEQAWIAERDSSDYRAQLDELLRGYVGRPTPLYHAARLSADAGHPIFLKREDLNHTGAHKINNAVGQALLAIRMGKRRIIAETGAGQHGVATATACALGGSNSIGIFTPFIADDGVELIGVEAAGEGIDTGRHGAPLTAGGLPGVLHGAYSALMQSEDGQILEAHSISAGLDYPGSGPEHVWLRDSGRARYEAVTDRQALDAFALCARLDGIIPALESAH